MINRFLANRLKNRATKGLKINMKGKNNYDRREINGWTQEMESMTVTV